MNIKELIAEEMCSICNKHNYDCTLGYIDCKYINERLDYILSLETPDTRLAIVRKVEVLPENPYEGFSLSRKAYAEGQQDMLKAGYVQEKREGYTIPLQLSLFGLRNCSALRTANS